MVNGKKVLIPNRMWTIIQRRFTVFVGSPVSDPKALFLEYFDRAPDSEASVRSEIRHKLSTELEGVSFSLTIQGLMASFAIEALNPDEMEKISVISDLNILSRFASQAATISQKIENISRIAVGEKYFMEASSRTDAYALMGAFLPSVDVDPDNSCDFFYRINRPRKSHWDGHQVVINRLSHWGCIVKRKTMFAGSNNLVIEDLHHGVSLDTDINSEPGMSLRILNSNAFPSVVTDLFSISRELSEKGDLP